MWRPFLHVCYLLLLVVLFISASSVQKVNAEEPYLSSMEWLSLKTREMPVGTQANDMPATSPLPSPPTLTIPELTQVIFQYPLLIKPAITTIFSPEHTAVDLAVPESTLVVASESGLVTEAGESTIGYGNTIVLNHTKNIYTRYAHLSVINVIEGQYILKGTPIGLVGSTGRSTGPHLHFEIRSDGQFIDPLSLVSL